MSFSYLNKALKSLTLGSAMLASSYTAEAQTPTPTMTPAYSLSTPTPMPAAYVPIEPVSDGTPVPNEIIPELAINGPRIKGSIVKDDYYGELEDDWYRFTTDTEGKYVIEIHAPLNPDFDSMIYLHNSPNKYPSSLITKDDDGGVENLSQIEIVLDGKTPYYVRVNGKRSLPPVRHVSTGDYEIDVITADRQTPTPTSTPMPTPPHWSWEPFGIEDGGWYEHEVEGRIFRTILADKDNQNILYAISTVGSTEGIAISYDNGETWKHTWSGNGNDSIEYEYGTWQVIQQATNGNLYTNYVSNTGGRTFCSKDRGKTWEEILDKAANIRMSNDGKTGYLRNNEVISKIDFDTNQIDIFATPDDDPVIGEGTYPLIDKKNGDILLWDKSYHELYRLDPTTKKAEMINIFSLDLDFSFYKTLDKYLVTWYDGDRSDLWSLTYIDRLSTADDYNNLNLSGSTVLPYPNVNYSKRMITKTREFDGHVWFGTTEGYVFRTKDAKNFEYMGQMQSRWGPVDVWGLAKSRKYIIGCDIYGLYRLLENGKPYAPKMRVAEFSNAWQTAKGQPNYNATYDLNNDNAVNQADLLMFMEELTPAERLQISALGRTPVMDWKMY